MSWQIILVLLPLVAVEARTTTLGTDIVNQYHAIETTRLSVVKKLTSMQQQRQNADCATAIQEHLLEAKQEPDQVDTLLPYANKFSYDIEFPSESTAFLVALHANATADLARIRTMLSCRLQGPMTSDCFQVIELLLQGYTQLGHMLLGLGGVRGHTQLFVDYLTIKCANRLDYLQRQLRVAC